jgi:2,3-diketo-5-methylthiopentyl-1-phosphate enolase
MMKSMYDWNLYHMPEGINPEEHVIATYLIEKEPEVDVLNYAFSIAIEQSTGTWVPVPEETPAVRQKHAGKVVGIYEIPNYEFELAAGLQSRTFVINIAFPYVNFGTQIPMLLSTVIGNISMMGRLKLLDLHFPRSFVREFKGPKFGISGIRKLLDIPERPLLNNMIKPCTGFPPEVGAKLFREAASGGVDIIKDDELLADAPFSRLEDRVKLYMEAERQAFEETGERTLYTVNITDRADRVRDNAKRAIDSGANALMLNYLTAGIPVLRGLAEDPDINVPILAHLDFAGVLYESPFSGMSSSLVLGKLPRLAGADIVVYPSPYDKFSFLRDRHLQIAQMLRTPFYDLLATFPMPGGGVHQGMVPRLVQELGADCIIGAGGAIHGHPRGPRAGGKAFRQAIDAVMAGIPLEQAAKENPELQAALKIWGTP